MKCHICGKPSIGQCQSCWKFYCLQHGDVFCQECADVQAAAQEPWLTGNTDEPDNQESGEGPVRLEVIPGVQIGDEKLRRVVPVVRSQTRGDTCITIITIEVYDIGFAMIDEFRRINEPLRPPGFVHAIPVPVALWSATDEEGRKYAAGRSGGSGEGISWRQRTEFGPGLPPDAKLLILSLEEVLWMATHGPGHRSPGPWRFEVPLT